MARKEKVFTTLNKLERENVKKAKELFAYKSSIYREGCDLINNLIADVTSKIILDYQDFAICKISHRIVGASKVLYELSIRGYDYDVNILSRCLYENTLVLEYVEENSDNAKKWFYRRLNLAEVKNHLAFTKTDASKVLYSSTSNYIHSNFEALFSLLYLPQNGSKEFGVYYQPKPIDASTDFIPNFWAIAVIILERHYEGTISKDLLKRINKIDAELAKLDKAS